MTFKPQYIASGLGLDYQFTEFFRRGKTSAILHRVFIGRGMVCSERTGGSLDILFRQN